MKKTQWIELFKNIRINFVSFTAITVFVMFGVALYSGMGWSGQALNGSIANEQDNGNMADIELIYPYGFDDEDIEQIKKVKGVSDAKGAYFGFSSFEHRGETMTAKLVMISDGINDLIQIEGELPKKQNELAIEKKWANDNGIKLGDEISFDKDGNETDHFLNIIQKGENPFLKKEDGNENKTKYLKTNVFKVTAFAESPAYISQMAAGYETSPATHTPADCIVFVPGSAFDGESFTGYPTLFIRSDETDGIRSGTAEYNGVIDGLKERIVPVAEKIANKKTDELDEAIENFKKLSPQNAVLPEISGVGVTAITRENNSSLSMEEIVADMFETLKYNLSVPFIIISILVSYSTVSRTINKDMKLIGAKKALGFSDGSVILSYILFSGMAALLGFILGLLISRFVIERLFLNVLGKTFFMGEPVWYFSLKEAVILGIIQLGSVLLSAFLAGRKTVSRPPIQLLSGDDQPAAKERFYEKSRLWKRLHLFTKSIIHNSINDKRRVAATLIGIAGCTALVICGTSLMVSVSDSFEYQFSELQDFKYVVYFDPDSQTAKNDIQKELEKKNARCTSVYYSTVRLSAPNGKDTVAALAVSDSDFDGLMKINSLDSGEKKLTDKGAWMSCAFALNYGIDENGGKITFTDAANNTRTVACAGVYEYYMQCPRILMSKQAYVDEFSEEPKTNAFFVASDEMGKKELNELLNDIPGYISILDYYTMMDGSFGIIIGVTSAIAILYLVLSVLMALFILLDLFVMFVEEKKRELITLMINGYKVSHAKKYIYFDTVFLTAIGIIIGVGAGIVFSNWNVNMMTSDVTYYLHRISIPSCIGAAVLSTFLTAVMCLFAMKRIKGYNLSDLA